MVLKMVGNLECDRRDMFSELSIRVQNILLPSHSPKKKKKNEMTVSHTHVLQYYYHYNSATKQAISSLGLGWYSQVFHRML